MKYWNNGLFSNHFLATRLTVMPQWASSEPNLYLRDRLREIYEKAQPGLAVANEAQTENDLIRPLLQAVGLSFDVQTGLAAWAGRRVPDYAIFSSNATRSAAVPLRGDSGYWPYASAVADAKAWSVGLDQLGGAPGGRTPAQQLTEYLRDSDLPWGVLTNGRQWRLYTRRSPKRATDYFEMELDTALYGEGEDFLLFTLVFGPTGLAPVAGVEPTFNDRLLQGSLTYARAIGERLRDRAFRTVEALARGFAEHERWASPSRSQLDELYENSLVLLYRLLFVLSAESRGLLPLDHPTYQKYSLTQMRKEVRERRASQSFAARSCDFYGRLTNLFRLIDHGDPAIDVPPYNGGLFDSDRHPFLRNSCCTDPALGDAIYQLTYDEDPETNAVEAIDYRDIAPRHLGTIYEGLLEFRLTVAEQPLGIGKREGVEIYVPESRRRPAVVHEGELYLHNDKGERRATGSYYTPDYIVDHIVKHALEPRLQGLAQQVATEVDRLRKTTDASEASDRQLAQEALEAYVKDVPNVLTSIRVLDPALGSGHFLVGAMHYIAEAIYTNPHYEPSEEDPDGILLRRRIAERCLFGVDFGELSVELARLTLWLETVAPDRPLSFLDHHLRVGNSLLGSWLSEVGQLKPAPSGYVSLAEAEFEKDLPTVIGELVAIGARDARSVDDVHEKIAHARRVRELVEPYRKVADFRTGVAGFALKGNQSLLDKAMMGIRDQGVQKELEADELWQAALAFARRTGFFHWEIEFPEAFFDSSGERLAKGGFDAVIGNPPYEVLETRKSDFQNTDGKWRSGGKERYEERTSELKMQRKYFRASNFPNATSGGKLDYYRLFVERAFQLADTGGTVGMIIPRSILGDKSATGVRSMLWTEANLDPVEVFPKDPPSCWVFPEAELAVTVFVARRSETVGTLRIREHPCRQIDDAREFTEALSKDSELLDATTLPIPVAPPDHLALIRRLYEDPLILRFKDVAPCHIGEINSEYGKPYMRDTPTANLLVRGRHVGRWVIEERTTLDVSKRWLDEAAYLAKNPNKKDDRPSSGPRIAKQAINDLNDPRRIIAALCQSGRYLLDSCDYLQPSLPWSPAFVLAVLLSDVSEWRFRMTSSNNNVNAYEIDELPFPMIEDWKAPARRDRAAELAGSLLRPGRGSEHEAGALVRSILADGGPRSAIHDAVAEAVLELSNLRVSLLDRLDTFRLALRSLEKGDRLGDEFVEGQWFVLSEEEFFTELRHQGLELTLDEISNLKEKRSESFGSLTPLMERASALDIVVNEAICALFGLSVDEVGLIQGSLPARPSVLSQIPRS